MGFYIFGHGGSADHSREDRLRGICSLLPERPEIGSDHPWEDWRYGISSVGDVFRRGTGTEPKPGDWCVDLRLPVKEPHPGVKRIFWGSDPGALNGSRLEQLSQYDLVAVSEPGSRKRLREAGLSNVITVPEPAFLVKPRLREAAFCRDTVGLCLTCPPAAGTLLYRSYVHLIRYLLEETSFHIALIPYSVRPGENDRLLFQALTKTFGDTGRIHLRQDAEAPLLRGDLFRCRCCVGGMGVLAAWGSGVPGLCLCATHRTLGLSQRLFGTWQEGVCPWEQLKREDQLTKSFQRFLRKEDRHRRCLEGGRGL